MPDRPYHHGNLRQELLAEAARTVRERGAGALSLRQLARDAGVSHAAPRRHFADRQALLDALAETGFVRLGDELRAAAEGTADGFEARLQATAEAYIHFATEDAALLEMMFASKRGVEAEPNDAAYRAFSVMLDLIRQGQESGALRIGEPERVGLILFATMQGIAALISAGMIETDGLDELVGDAISRFLRGSRATA